MWQRTTLEAVGDNGLGQPLVVDVDRVVLAAAGHIVAAARQAHKVLVVGVPRQRPGAEVLISGSWWWWGQVLGWS